MSQIATRCTLKLINYLYEKIIGGDVMKNKEKLFDFLQKNYGWMVATITGLTVATSFILRFIKYMYSTFYFNYYGLSYGLFNGDELSVLYNFTFSILTSFIFCER